MRNSNNHVLIQSGAVSLEGDLFLRSTFSGIVLFAHGSGSSRHSPRNQFVASVIHKAGIGTLLFDLLTPEEEAEDMFSRRLRFDIGLLTQRLVDATEWLIHSASNHSLRIGYFGSSTGAAAALSAAAHFGNKIHAVVSRGGRTDLAEPDLKQVTAPTLLIVGSLDDIVIEINNRTLQQLQCKKGLSFIPGATHLFEEEGTLELVAQYAANWFKKHLI